MTRRVLLPLVHRVLLRRTQYPSACTATHGRFLVALNDTRMLSRSASSSVSSSSASPVTPLPPVLSPPLPPAPILDNNPDLSDKSWMQKLVDRFSPETQRQLIVRAEAMYQAATRQASDPLWFGPGRIPRDFRPRHGLLTMHIWFLHKRLIADDIDKESALTVQEELFNILWEDTTCRIRQQGVQELLVNKSLLQVQQYTFLHLTHYDHVYTELLDKPAERLKELRRLVWQHILVRDDDAEHRYDQLDRLAWYIEANYQNILLHWPDEYYRQARVAWVNLPDFEGMRDAHGQILPPSPVHAEDVLPEAWLRNITLRGIEYYWNPHTMQSSWERPKA